MKLLKRIMNIILLLGIVFSANFIFANEIENRCSSIQDVPNDVCVVIHYNELKENLIFPNVPEEQIYKFLSKLSDKIILEKNIENPQKILNKILDTEGTKLINGINISESQLDVIENNLYVQIFSNEKQYLEKEIIKLKPLEIYQYSHDMPPSMLSDMQEISYVDKYQIKTKLLEINPPVYRSTLKGAKDHTAKDARFYSKSNGGIRTEHVSGKKLSGVIDSIDDEYSASVWWVGPGYPAFKIQWEISYNRGIERK
ncbi:hypothetical protein [Clostridiisalibacter paucivorans]|uniref:hypothetical protein n=1 Tax=Clostridiisalibacter paucivorans TaxID=408753 RepID=UPI00047EB8F1|nr:hypothetical protein [Clostridiisalibacter paucivorans]